MLKSKNKLFFMFIFLMMFVPFININAKTETVNSESDFKKALADNDVSTIVLGSNIDTTEKITITRPVTIDGNNHTMRYTGTFKNGGTNKTWNGIYLLQVYRTSAVIKDIKLTGGNAALLINGSNVTLEGNIDVSGNGFGGIELSQGKGVTEKVKVTISDETKIINTTDSESTPTLWVPEDSDDATIQLNDISITIKSGEELSIEELEDILIDENPNTIDFINIYLTLFILGILIFLISVNKLKKSKGALV